MITIFIFVKHKYQIMRLGEVFSNFGNKVKNFGLRVGSTLSHIAKPALKYGSFIAGGLSHLPGFIGTAAGVAYKGLNAANRLINSLPDSSFKAKLQDLSDKAATTTSNIQPKLMNAAKSAVVVGDTAGKIIDAIKPRII